MIDTKELRRLAQAATSGEWYVERGNHICGRIEVTDGEEEWHPVIACTDDDETNVDFEANAAFIAAANPTAISELLDRLEAAEKERDELRAKIEQMEKQEPVAWMLNCQTLSGDTGWILSWTQSGAGLCNRLKGEENEKKLYALPGAQPAPIVPEGWKLVPIELTTEMEEAGYYTSGSFTAAAATYAAMLAAAPKPEVK